VIGVVMRFGLLEGVLLDRVRDVLWVSKYGEEGSFGLVKDELLGEVADNFGDGIQRRIVDEALTNDPLLRMCRAECLYALFLVTVEGPTMKKMKQPPVPGGSGVDFLDTDKMEVLCYYNKNC